MYDQEFQEEVLFMMLYAGVTVLNLMACCYLLFRRANAIAPDVMSPVRLRKWTAAFLAALALSHLWYLPSYFITSSDDARLCFIIGGLLDCLTIFPLVIVTLFVMLQDRRRPLWPAAVMVAPLVVGMALCVASRSMVFLPMLYIYLILLSIGLIIYMVHALRQYGHWLRDNYADLENKEVWQSLLVLATILLGFSLYALEVHGFFYRYATQVNDILLTCFLVWRVDTLSDLSVTRPLPLTTEEKGAATEVTEDALSSAAQENIGLLLQRHCVDTQLYLQHDLNVQQLSKEVGTNRLYLSQYFSSRGLHYNDYINELRIRHFVNLYREAVTSKRDFTIQQLANECGYHSYSTFSRVFKQQMGKNVTAWMRDTGK